MTHAEQWLAAVWPVVRRRLPSPPARVLEIGCGPLGGFVPRLRSSGYEAVGVDPNAPAEASYRRVEFEHAEPFDDLDAVVASTSLHHVDDPADVLDRVAGSLARGGAVVVVEWAWEIFDEETAEWGFERLAASDEPGWLHRRRDAWLASGEPWPDYLRGWAASERLHSAESLLRLLDQRFERKQLDSGPYLFPALAGTSADDEQAAIAAGRIRALRRDYVGTLTRP